MPRVVQRSQFGDPALSTAEAYSACGPSAATAFARVNGRNPSLREAVDLAKSVGWTADAGMAGPASEQALLAKMGVTAELAPAADWARVAGDVRAGKPVIVSTPRHYFTVSDVDDRGRFYVGASGTDLKGGAEWMTADEITAAGRGVNGALHLTGAPAPVPAERQAFLEANAPGESGPTTSTSVAESPSRPASGPRHPEPTQPGDMPSAANNPPQTTAGAGSAPELPQEVKDWLTGQRMHDALTRKIMGQINDVPAAAPAFQLPGVPQITLGWNEQRRFRLPGVG